MLIHAAFDNQQNIKMYPPSEMTTNTTTIDGQTYIANQSSNVAGYGGFRAFDFTVTPWQSQSNRYTSGTANGTVTTTLIDETSYAGEWVQINLPNAIILDTFELTSSTSSRPKDFKILGTNNDPANVNTRWNILFETTDIDNIIQGGWQINQIIALKTNTTTPYIYFRLAVYKTKPNSVGAFTTFVLLREMRLYTDTSVNRSSLIYNNASLYGRYKVNLISLYTDSFNYGDTWNLLNVSSPQLVVPGSSSLLILQEVPVSDNLTKKLYHSFSESFDIVAELNGKIEIYFKRDGNNALFKKALLVMKLEKIV